MRGLFVNIFRTQYNKKSVKMTNISRDAPIGIQCFQRLCVACCPRLHFDRLRCYQISVLVLTYFTYMTYHLTRKPISVVKSVLHQNCSSLSPPPGVDPHDDQWCNWAPFDTSDANTLLGMLDSAFLFSYAGAMFMSGMIAERVDLRYFLSFGMLSSGIFCYLFGLGRTLGIHNIFYYILVQIGAGVCQTTGWPGSVSVVGKWFGNSKKGLIFGIWNSHTSLGNILGTLMAAEYVETDWALSFVYPGLVMGVMATVVFLFLVPHPTHVGLSFEESVSKSSSRRSLVEEEPSQVIGADQSIQADESTSLLTRPSSTSAVSLSRALSIPGVVEFSLSLFFAKLVSYTFLFWLPLYINSSTHLTPKQSGDVSTVFDVGGIVGGVLAGLLADYSGAPGLVCGGFYLLCAPTLFIYQIWGATSFGLNVFLLIITGALVNAPYALITTAVSAELGTHSSLVGNSQALATVTAIIDGTGSVGAAIGPMLAGVVSSSGTWSHVFYMLMICNFMALFLLLRIIKSEIAKLRHDRRMLSVRDVRIE